MSNDLKIIWRGDAATKTVMKSGNARIVAAGMHLRNKIRFNISIPSNTKKSSHLGKEIGTHKSLFQGGGPKP